MIMKYIYTLVSVLLTFTFVNAQEQRVIKEDFDSNRLRWDEFYEKDYYGGIQDGFFVLQNKKDGFVSWSVTDFPIDIDNNFNITFKFLVPRLSDKYYFGIIFDYEDENNYRSFRVSEKRYKIVNTVNGISSLSRQGSIILTSGRNKEVIIDMEKKGNKLLFNVDNMEAVEITIPRTRSLNSNSFGFLVEDANTIKVDEVIISQIVRDDNE